jgi:hypothetical protein
MAVYHEAERWTRRASCEGPENAVGNCQPGLDVDSVPPGVLPDLGCRTADSVWPEVGRGSAVTDQPDAATLRAKAREAIQRGKLPTTQPAHKFGGEGSGAICPVCGESVRPQQMELEVHFARPGGALDRYHLHPRCCAAWETERLKHEGASS